jgi:triacylglycerol esterase/lipase EstA (alpha/beta hydrolase family)
MYARATILILLMAVLVGGIGPVLALIALLVALTFATAALHAPPRPAGTELGFAALVRLWLHEAAAACAITLVLMPLERWLMRRSIAGRRAELPPVLLVHGYINNAGALFILWRRFKNAGFPVHTLNLEPVYADIEAYVPRIEARLADVQAVDARRVVMVCHSMGGLVARAYLRRHGAARVAQVITLGSPHAGTVMAHTALGENGRQMGPGSPWLTRLAADEGGAWPCPMTSLYSLDDNIVVPALSARLPGARNIEISGVGHMSLPMSPRVARRVEAEVLAGPRA